MVDALTVTANGLLSAQRRANDLAVEILDSVSREASFEESLTEQSTEQPQQAANPAGPQGRPLVQQIADLKSAEIQFRANAKAFEAITETQDQFLGTLIDDEG